MMKTTIEKTKNGGCDVIVRLDSSRKSTKIRLLQITDMQVIDSSQRRTPDRLRIDEINAWVPEQFDALCGNHIRSLVTQTKPDLIFITGDIVYGSFDDKGTTLEWFCSFMDSLAIPWAPTFGNHDNESKKGVEWQCEQFEKSKYCVFQRGTVSGNSNYTVGIAVGDELIRVLHLADSNGCRGGEDGSVVKEPGLYPDQIELIRNKTEMIEKEYGKNIPAFLAFHIPVKEFEAAERSRGYRTEARECYTVGVDVPSQEGDFGFKLERFRPIETDENFLNTLKQCRIEAVFAGHCHSISTVIGYEGIQWVFGLKTGQYDYHIPGQLGGTLITLEDEDFEVRHVPSLVAPAPFPGGAKMFEHFFAEDQKIIEYKREGKEQRNAH